MREISLEELLEAGCHFGHQVTRQNPRARDFIFEARDNIHIIDLAKTKEGLEQAGEFVRDLAAKGGSLIVIGTKRQAQSIVLEEIKRVQTANARNLYYVTNRWVGGMLTNFQEVAKNYKKLKDIGERLKNEEERAKYTKKEIGLWEKERQKLESFYGGIQDMQEVPDALFIIDTHLEHLAVQEAQKMGVTTVGIVDTNADPAEVSYAIPANDDAVGSLKLIITYIMDAWIEGSKALSESATREKPATTEDTVKKPVRTEKKQSKIAVVTTEDTVKTAENTDKISVKTVVATNKDTEKNSGKHQSQNSVKTVVARKTKRGSKQ